MMLDMIKVNSIYNKNQIYLKIRFKFLIMKITKKKKLQNNSYIANHIQMNLHMDLMSHLILA
jgi:hypothetical protein